LLFVFFICFLSLVSCPLFLITYFCPLPLISYYSLPMSDATHQTRSLILGPVLCTVLLGAMMLQGRTYRTEKDFEPFHARAADAINRISVVIPPWVGREQPLREDERKLLEPNAYRCIAFNDTRASALADPSRVVLLMVAQCKQANKMLGHYPPACYPSRGHMLTNGQGTPRDWTIGRLTVQGMEYQFERKDRENVIKTTVYNFMILPEQGIRRDMKAVTASAEDYEQRYYGAAQVQMVFGAALAENTPDARHERDTIFAELIGPNADVIRILTDGVETP
jgi:hypothetical protein